jgi:hypothetical protein
VGDTEISWHNHRVVARVDHLRRLGRLLREFPVVGLVGARQVGKTTLARAFARDWRGAVTYLDLENPADRARLAARAGVSARPRRGRRVPTAT